MMAMKTANATWAPSILRSAVDTVGEQKGHLDQEGSSLFDHKFLIHILNS